MLSNSLSFSSFSISLTILQISARAVFSLSSIILDKSLFAVRLCLFFLSRSFLFLLSAVFFSMPYPMAIKAVVFFHMFIPFFDSHFVNVHCVWVFCFSGVSWCESSLDLTGSGGGSSSSSSKDFFHSSILCIMLRCLFVPFFDLLGNGLLHKDLLKDSNV